MVACSDLLTIVLVRSGSERSAWESCDVVSLYDACQFQTSGKAV